MKTYIDIINAQGLVTKIDLGISNYQDQIYRSVMPYGSYDGDHQVMTEWHKQKFDWIICLCPRTEFIRKANRSQDEIYGDNYKCIHFPIKNYECPTDFDSLNLLLAELKILLKNNERIVIHCSAGIGRTGLILGCFLLYLGVKTEDAITTIQSNIISSFNQPTQLEYLRYFSKYLMSH